MNVPFIAVCPWCTLFAGGVQNLKLLTVSGVVRKRKPFGGLKITEDGLSLKLIEKMSKSKKNVVDPDDIISSYGADTARLFMLSDSPPERDVIWTEAGAEGAHRFVQRVWRLISSSAEILAHVKPQAGTKGAALDISKAAHRTLAKVADDIEKLAFNRAVARLYELVNKLAPELQNLEQADDEMKAALRQALDFFIIMISPMTPHLAEECHAALGEKNLVAQMPWPHYDRSAGAARKITRK